MAKLLVALELVLIGLGITWVTMLSTVGADAILLLVWDGGALIYLATGGYFCGVRRPRVMSIERSLAHAGSPRCSRWSPACPGWPPGSR